VALAPLKAMKRGAQSTPGSVRPKSPPPLSREEVESHREGEGQEMGAPRPQGPKEMVRALGAIPPLGDANLGDVARPAQIEEGRAIVASKVAPLGGPHGKGPARPEAPAAGETTTPRGARALYSGPTSTTQREGPDLFWTIRRRFTSGTVWTRAGMPASRPSIELLSS